MKTAKVLWTAGAIACLCWVLFVVWVEIRNEREAARCEGRGGVYLKGTARFYCARVVEI